MQKKFYNYLIPIKIIAFLIFYRYSRHVNICSPNRLVVFVFFSLSTFTRVADGLATHRPGSRFGRDRGGHRPTRLLPVGGMGHYGRAGGETREVLRVLRGTVPGHILQHHATAKDTFLHG